MTTVAIIQSRTVQWPSSEFAISTVLQADSYATVRLQFICRIIGILLLATAISILQTFFTVKKSAEYGYIQTSQYGQILPLVELHKPNLADAAVVDWAITAVAELYTMDYVNYRKQLQVARHNLTTMGWKNYQNAMILSGNHKAIVGNSFVTHAEATGAGRIAGTGDLRGRFMWKVEFPMKISYHKSQQNLEISTKVIEQNLQVSATVIRVPEYINESGLGIRAIIAE